MDNREVKAPEQTTQHTGSLAISDISKITESAEISNPSDLRTTTGPSRESRLTKDLQENDDDADEQGIKFKDWGFKVDRLFEVAYRFYKRNESKAFHPTFDERNQMNALILQSRYGNYDEGKTSDPGALDLVGKSRKHAWTLLKGMSRTEAMSEFICTLDKICPFFKAYAEAVKISTGVKQQNSWRETIGINDSIGRVFKQGEIESDEQLKAIHTSLCRQTYNQFKNYAERQFPNDQPKQKYLISTLQEQYYQQYISKMHPELSNSQSYSSRSSIISTKSNSSSNSSYPSPNPIITNGTPNSVTEENPSAKVLSQAEVTNQVQSSANFEDISLDDKLREVNSVRKQAINPQLDDYSSQRQENQQETNHPCSKPLIQEYSKKSPVISNIESNSSIKHVQQLVESKLPDLQVVDETVSKLQGKNCLQKSESCYQHVEPKSIGTFESYPEPKPIQRASNTAKQKSVISNLFNPYSSRKDLQQQPDSSHLSPSHISGTNNEVNIPASAQSLENNTAPDKLRLEENGQLPQDGQQQQFPSPTNMSVSAHPGIEADHYPMTGDMAPLTNENLLKYETTSYQDDLIANKSTVIPKQAAVDSWSCGSGSSGAGSPLQQSITYEPLEAASIWTKKGVHEFKDSLVDDRHGGTYVIKQGTLLTIQVPTYPNGKYIYWEFISEDYDVGFGLDFIYAANLEKPLAMKIYEETDEDDDEFDESEIVGEDNTYDPEMAAERAGGKSNGAGAREALLRKRAEKFAKAANTISILPTYRRDSHEEVYVGRHRYPAQGYYLLRFDNTYSVLRSKTIYFRICYFI